MWHFPQSAHEKGAAKRGVQRPKQGYADVLEAELMSQAFFKWMITGFVLFAEIIFVKWLNDDFGLLGFGLFAELVSPALVKQLNARFALVGAAELRQIGQIELLFKS